MGGAEKEREKSLGEDATFRGREKQKQKYERELDPKNHKGK